MTALVTRARDGDKQAWDAIEARCAPLIWTIRRRYRLDRPDADDVGQSVWLRLVDQLALIRDPAALPGRIATTPRREYGRAVSPTRARCLQRLRQYPAVAALVGAGTMTAGGDASGQPAMGR